MTNGSPGSGVERIPRAEIVGAYPVEDSDRGEFLLKLRDLKGNITVIGISCDPIMHDENGVPFLPEDPRRAEKWEVYLFDATDSEAGKLIKNDEGRH